MITKSKAVDLAVTYNAYLEAQAGFCGNPCEDTAISLRVWARALERLQDSLQITIADSQQLLNAIDLTKKFTQ